MSYLYISLSKPLLVEMGLAVELNWFYVGLQVWRVEGLGVDQNPIQPLLYTHVQQNPALVWTSSNQPQI